MISLLMALSAIPACGALASSSSPSPGARAACERNTVVVNGKCTRTCKKGYYRPKRISDCFKRYYTIQRGGYYVDASKGFGIRVQRKHQLTEVDWHFTCRQGRTDFHVGILPSVFPPIVLGRVRGYGVGPDVFLTFRGKRSRPYATGYLTYNENTTFPGVCHIGRVRLKLRWSRNPVPANPPFDASGFEV